MAPKSHLFQHSSQDLEQFNIDIDSALLELGGGDEDHSFNELMTLLDETDRMCDEFEQVLTLQELVARNNGLSQDTRDFIGTLPVFSFLGVGTESYQSVSDINRRLDIGTEGFLDTIKKAAGAIKNAIVKAVEKQTDASNKAINISETAQKSAEAIAEKVEKAPEVKSDVTFTGLPMDKWQKTAKFYRNNSSFLKEYLAAEIKFREELRKKAERLTAGFVNPDDPNNQHRTNKNGESVIDQINAEANELGDSYVKPLVDKLFSGIKTEFTVQIGNSQGMTYVVPYYDFAKDLHFEKVTVTPIDQQKYRQLVIWWAGELKPLVQQLAPELKKYQESTRKFKETSEQNFKAFDELYSKVEKMRFEDKGVVLQFQLTRAVSRIMLRSMQSANRSIRNCVRATVLLQKTARNFSDALKSAN